jgi:3,4-dihydroxy 2-butanone 4-phosphate synthase/GTP cyclohydrolase II
MSSFVSEPIALGGHAGAGAPVCAAVSQAAAGRPVIVAGTEGREANLVVAAELITSESVAFMVRHTSGFLCVALPSADCDRLGLPPMWPLCAGPGRAAFTVTVDAAVGVGTGISASDRARTIRLLGRPDTIAADLVRPGHVVPCLVAEGGVLARPGAAESASDLARVAGLRPVAVYGAVVSERHRGQLADGAELAEFAARHRLAMISTGQLTGHCRALLGASVA